MTLYLLRHGDVAEYATSDVSRSLSEQGEQQARVAGTALMRMQITPDVVIASPLARAQQMASVLCEAMNIERFATSEHLVPQSNPRQMVTELNATTHNSVLLIGHEPQLRSFVSLLISNSSQTDILFKKGSLGCVLIHRPIAFGKGTLAWLISTEQMQLFH